MANPGYDANGTYQYDPSVQHGLDFWESQGIPNSDIFDPTTGQLKGNWKRTASGYELPVQPGASDYKAPAAQTQAAPTPATPSASAASSVVQSWQPAQAGGMFPSWYQDMMERTLSQQETQRAATQAKADTLYGTLLDRSNQSLTIDRNDPNIRQQAAAFGANTDRSRRDYLGNLAESAGPFANLRGEARMTGEKAGQAKGTFEAGLVGSELKSRRDEIAQSLNSMAGILSGEQTRNLQGQLAAMDQAIAEAGVGVATTGINAGAFAQGNSYDLGLRNLGFNDWDRQMYYDALNSGRLG